MFMAHTHEYEIRQADMRDELVRIEGWSSEEADECIAQYFGYKPIDNRFSQDIRNWHEYDSF